MDTILYCPLGGKGSIVVRCSAKKTNLILHWSYGLKFVTYQVSL
jgi:hypothetical protein